MCVCVCVCRRVSEVCLAYRLLYTGYLMQLPLILEHTKFHHVLADEKRYIPALKCWCHLQLTRKKGACTVVKITSFMTSVWVSSKRALQYRRLTKWRITGIYLDIYIQFTRVWLIYLQPSYVPANFMVSALCRYVVRKCAQNPVSTNRVSFL